MALGLPVAVTIGWQLATPATRSAAVDAPGGAGGMGDAPARHLKQVAEPASTSAVMAGPSVMPSAPPGASTAAVSTPVGPILSGVVTSAPTGLPSIVPTEASQNSLPPLTMPPVPTPTEPDDPGASPSVVASASPTDSAETGR